MLVLISAACKRKNCFGFEDVTASAVRSVRRPCLVDCCASATGESSKKLLREPLGRSEASIVIILVCTTMEFIPLPDIRNLPFYWTVRKNPVTYMMH